MFYLTYKYVKLMLYKGDYLKVLTIIFFIFISIVFISNNKQPKNTQVVITISDLTNEDLFYLNNEFNQHSNIDFVDGSIESNTIAINVDSKNFNQSKLINMLEKWNCKAVNFDYNTLSDIADIE